LIFSSDVVAGQLGYGNMNNLGNQVSEMGDYLPYVNLGTGRTVFQHSSGGSTCALLDSGEGKCWGGENSYGQLGKGNTDYLGDDPNEMGDYLATMLLGGGVVIDRFSLGSFACCVITKQNRLKCWGLNAQGLF